MRDLKHYDLVIEFNDKINVIEGRKMLENFLKENEKVSNFQIKHKVEEFEGNVVVINNVALPVLFQESFTTPDWEKLFAFYPKYLEEADESPLDFPEYCERIAKELEIRKCRGNRDHLEWLRIMFNHIGYEKFENLCIKYNSLS